MRVLNGEELPHSLKIISDLLDSFIPPDGKFDPTGEWEHNYAYWVPLRNAESWKTWRAGSLTVSRKIQPMGIELVVEQISGRQDHQEQLEARIAVKQDKLATPIMWRLIHSVIDADGKPVQYTESWTRGKAEPGGVRILTTVETRHPVGDNLSGRWPILDAVQRLPFKSEPLHFDFLEDMALVKRGHRLDYARDIELEFSDRRITLHGFEHIGSGILPTTYWVDDSHRLLFAVGGLRAFIFEEKKADG